jgi:TonB family protein
MLVLFIGGSYALWIQNQLDNQKLAQKLKMDSPLRYDISDTLPFPPSESKSVLTIVYNRKKGVQTPPVLAIITEEVARAASNDVLVKSSTTDDVEFSEYRHMKKSDSREDESNTYTDSRANPVPAVRHGGAAMKKEDPDETGTILTYVKEMPSFPGGDSERLKFLSKNIRYPQQASENGVHGTVFVSFVVKKDGSLDDVKILQGIGNGCDEEAIRVVKKMPRWNPGYQNGKKVAVLFHMNIDFRLK